jgi:hypothetical protein
LERIFRNRDFPSFSVSIFVSWSRNRSILNVKNVPTIDALPNPYFSLGGVMMA